MDMTDTQKQPDKFVVEYADGSPSHTIEGVATVAWDRDDVRMYADTGLLFLAPMGSVRCVRKVVTA